MAQEAFGLQDNSAGESAEKARRAINYLLQRGATIGSVLGGLVAATDLQATYQGAGLKVEVSPGEAIVPGTISATQSGYYFRNTAAATFTLAAANASNPRIERIVAVVLDEAYEGTHNEAKIEVKEGTAKAGATLSNLEGVAPAPKNSITLAYVLVPAKATTISNSEIKNVAERVGLGLSPLATQTRAASWTAVSGEQAVVTANGATGTMPAAANGQLISVTAGNGITTTLSGGTFYGDFTSGASSLTLLSNQHVLLLSWEGVWLIIAGEPKRQQTYSAVVARGFATEYEPSAIRDAMVAFTLVAVGGSKYELSVGGTAIFFWEAAATITTGYNFRCPAGTKWKVTSSSGLGTPSSSYLLL